MSNGNCWWTRCDSLARCASRSLVLRARSGACALFRSPYFGHWVRVLGGFDWLFDVLICSWCDKIWNVGASEGTSLVSEQRSGVRVDTVTNKLLWKRLRYPRWKYNVGHSAPFTVGNHVYFSALSAFLIADRVWRCQLFPAFRSGIYLGRVIVWRESSDNNIISATCPLQPPLPMWMTYTRLIAQSQIPKYHAASFSLCHRTIASSCLFKRSSSMFG